ncbi:MAG: biotin/lipoyl-binding protein [Pirellulales bacterium]
MPASPKLRADVKFHARPGDDAHMVVEDPKRGHYYRIGVAEYALLCEFDGHTPLDVALQRARGIHPALDLSLAQAATLAQWVEGAQLAYRSTTANATELIGWAKAEADAARRAWTNPFFLRFPLLCPDRLLTAAVPWLGWFFSLPATLATLAAATWVLLPLTGKWREVVGDLEDLFTPHRQLALLAVWMGMKIVHEFGHGLVCKRYGGYVREAGVTLILFAPTAYIDVTSAWRFASRWRRIHISAAGMYLEVLISALAAVVWQSTSSDVVRQVAADVILAGTISTLLFNLNPLMRFDGYYILGDLLELQNLYESGRRYVQYWAKRRLLGMPVAAPRLPPRRAWFVRLFGFAATVWYIVATASAIAGLSLIFHGAGLLLAIVGVAWWYVAPAVRLIRWLFGGRAAERPNPGRAALITGGGAALAMSILVWTPASLLPTAPAIVEYAPPTILRARTPGFVERICVVDGQQVKRDQLLCVLQNDELQLEFASLESQLARAEIRTTAHRQRLSQFPQDHLAYQEAMSEREALTKRVSETRGKIADLEIRAPHEGRLVRRRLDRLTGVYLYGGDEIVSLGSEDAKQLHVSLAQGDVETLSRTRPAAVRTYVPGVGSWNAELARLDPRATVQPPHMSLCAPNGGPLAVVRTGSELEFATPRFSGFIALDPDQARQLRVGQRGTVSLGAQSESLGAWLVHWCVQKWEQAIHVVH